MGKWIKRKADEHQCDMPFSVPHNTEVGDIWRCECGKKWGVSKIKFHYMEPSIDPREHSYYTATWYEYGI